ncbi:hypothetical protein ACFW9D_11835 [Streptomyces sp. NPDC059524]|uniref:hypothetical protein n=1 Tax=Streptomyces sp. NPDC059524 TaxID=3346856 RepID=UPI0036C78B1F
MITNTDTTTDTTRETNTGTTTEETPGGGVRRLIVVVLGLTALVTVMLCAFALPSAKGAPHDVPVGVTGSQQVTRVLEQKLAGDAWDVRVYDGPEQLRSAIRDRDVAGGLAVAPGGVDVYTATAGGPSATGALTALSTQLAAQQHAEPTVHDLVPFTADDPRGAGLTAALLPMIFGGIFPAVILGRVFPGHRGLRARLAGVLAFAVVAGAAVAAFLQYGTGTLDGDYVVTAAGLALGMAALASVVIGLQALFGGVGLGIGGAVMMLLGNPLSGLATGPHWLPAGWALLGQLLPPGASGSLLRANGFFDGTGAARPALTLAAWVVAGIGLVVLADLRGRRRGAEDAEDAVAAPERAEAVAV